MEGVAEKSREYQEEKVSFFSNYPIVRKTLAYSCFLSGIASFEKSKQAA
jgi:hypothetical protein